MTASAAALREVWVIRDFVADDAEQVVALNQACVPEVGPMDREKLDWFVEQAPYSEGGGRRRSNRRSSWSG